MSQERSDEPSEQLPPEVARPEPPFVADEATMLPVWLDYHRATLERKIAGLSPEQLATRAVAPSTLSLLGLVRHLTEVERSWCQRVFLGRSDAPALYYDDTNPDGDLDDVDPAHAERDLAAWRAEIAASRAAVSGRSLDELSLGFRDGEHPSLRWIMVHLVEEHARHNGHADLLRERIDGAVGE